MFLSPIALLCSRKFCFSTGAQIFKKIFSESFFFTELCFQEFLEFSIECMVHISEIQLSFRISGNFSWTFLYHLPLFPIFERFGWMESARCFATTTTSNNNWFYEQNDCSARESRFLVHFFDVHCTTTTWNLPMRRFMEDVDIRKQIFRSLFEHG